MYYNTIYRTGSGYDELNADIEQFVKQKKFPDYHDIRSLVTAYSTKSSLNLR